MKDFNFFASYSKKKERKINKDYILYGIIILILAVMVFKTTVNLFAIKKLKSELALLEDEIQTTETDGKVKDIQNKEDDVKDLKEKIDKLSALDEYASKNDIINEYLLLEIENSLPAKVFLKKMVLNSETIKIEGNSQDKDSIAQFQHNLKNLDAFSEVFIPNISNEEDYFTFNMDLRLLSGE